MDCNHLQLDTMEALQAQLPEVEAMCQLLYLAQVHIDTTESRSISGVCKGSILTRLFRTQSPEERQRAEQALAPFSRSIEYIPHCKVRCCLM